MFRLSRPVCYYEQYQQIPHVYYSYDTDGFNAGVWLLLNDKVGKNIINECDTLYNPSNWRKVKNKWLWSGVTRHIYTDWAGPDFDVIFVGYPNVPASVNEAGVPDGSGLNGVPMSVYPCAAPHVAVPLINTS